MLNLEGSLSRLDTFKQLSTHVTHENSSLFECSGGTPAYVSTLLRMKEEKLRLMLFLGNCYALVLNYIFIKIVLKKLKNSYDPNRT